MSVSISEKTIGEIFSESGNRYVVPRYQREYAWGREEIGTMLTDLWESFRISPERKYYLGTLVVKKNDEKNYREVIDGQQRLTTLTLLMRFMHAGSSYYAPLSFATRKPTNIFLANYCCADSYEAFSETRCSDVADEKKNCCPYCGKGRFECDCVPPSFNAAINLIRNFRPSLKDGGLHHLSIGSGLLKEQEAGVSFSDYIVRMVVMFEVEMPPDTDEMDYFEVMNNRGEQLEYHEILKAELLAQLHVHCSRDDAPEALRGKYEELSHTFNILWTACSKMDGHLIDHLHACRRLKDDPGLCWTELTSLKDDLDESGVPHERQSVIRNFSIFLMQVLRLYVANRPNAEVAAEDISLDERGIKKVFELVNRKQPVDPVDFLQTLIVARLNYDRYVIKAKMENDVVVKWRLKEIICQKGKYEARSTFSDEHIQRKILYLQAALQVSNASQRHKEWVYAILSAKDDIRNSGTALLNLLEEFAVRRILAYRDEWKEKLWALGLQTPRLLLNVIDYLMWNASEEKRRLGGYDEFQVPRDFVFGYQTSIEHHHAQCDDTGDNPWTQEQKDNIGNLYLTSNTENSSMGKHRTKEKVSIYRHAHEGAAPTNPKRNWMYVHTGDDWPLEAMERLGKYVMVLVDDLLKRRLLPEPNEKLIK